MTDKSGQKIDISPDFVGKRVDQYLNHLYPGIPYGAWARLFRKGNIRLDGKRVKGSERLEKSHAIRLPPKALLTPLQQQTKQRQVCPLSAKMKRQLESWIIYEDETIIALNKPAGLASQGGTKTSIHLDGLLYAWGQEKNCQPKLVHRLDKETSGIILLAKTTACAANLSKSFQKRLIQKTYCALITGSLTPPAGVIQSKIGLKSDKGKEYMGSSAEGQSAYTRYLTLSKSGNIASCLVLHPKTGRTHQLRVHLSEKGSPILGDTLYGSRQNKIRELPAQLFLHAHYLSFQHPFFHKKITLHAPLPPHFLTAFNYFGFCEKEISRKLYADHLLEQG